MRALPILLVSWLGLTAAHAATFDQTLKTHLDAINRRDLPALLDTVADDVMLILPTGKLLEGKQAYTAFHKEFFAEKTWSMRFTEKRRVENGDTAFVLLQYVYSDKDEKGADYRSESYLVMVFRRNAGKWRLTHDQNTRIPPS
jgi:uncharacterized protein (TIGR02246 family)